MYPTKRITKRMFILLHILGFNYKTKNINHETDPDDWDYVVCYDIYARANNCYYKLRMKRTVTTYKLTDGRTTRADPIIEITVTPKLPNIYPQFVARTDLQLFLPVNFFIRPSFHSSVFQWNISKNHMCVNTKMFIITPDA